MYLFRRTRVMNPHAAGEARAFAVDIAALASTITGRPITPFETVFGGPAGTIAWSTPVADMVDLDELQQKLLADPEYAKTVSAGAAFFGGNAEDNLEDLVANGISTSDNAMYSGLQVVARSGSMLDAVTFGVRAQEHMQNAGFETAFGASVFGQLGQFGWLVSLDSMARLDELQAFVTTDPGYAELSAAAAEVFDQSLTVRRLARRLG